MHNATTEQIVELSLDSAIHLGNMAVPQQATGIVLFVHGSGSSRLSPRNNYVAGVLRQGGIATLLFDLLTEAEDRVYETRFDIDLLARRLMLASDWVKQQETIGQLPMGYFGASTGAAAALKAAAARGLEIRAVVSRGGRPDLAGADLSKVQAATLLIVGGHDEPVIALNQQAYDELRHTKALEIIPGATHLFEEAGTLEQVAHMATDWFVRYLHD